VVPVAMGGVNETLIAWTLRDEGYSSVLVGEGIVRGSEMRMSTGLKTPPPSYTHTHTHINKSDINHSHTQAYTTHTHHM
jgi:hypothetical protein